MKNKKLLADSNPNLLDEWDYSLNGDLNPKELYRSSNENVWWKCKEDSRHQWQATVKRRVYNHTGCLYCAGKLVLEEESFAAKHPDLMQEWDWEKNKNLDPKSLSCGSKKKAYWICKNNPSHTWRVDLYHRSYNRTGCRKCANLNKEKRGRKKLLVNDYPSIAKEWDFEKNTGIDINKITHASAKRVSWVCNIDETHKWESTVTNRTSKQRGCPYCNGELPSKKNSLKSIYPEVAEEWGFDKNFPLKPEDVTRASGKKVWWVCKNDPDHEWDAVVRNRTILGSNCPHCENEIKAIRLKGYMLDNSSVLTKHYKLFVKNLFSIESIIKEVDFSMPSYNKTFLRLAYSSIITSLEAYLSDYFMERVLASEDKMDKLFRNAKEFKNRKMSINEALIFSDRKSKEVEQYIHDVIWHNLPKVEHLYRKVLSIEFDSTLSEDINRHISVRHDIVHRNGRCKDGRIHHIDKVKVEECLASVKNFIEKIELDSSDI